MARQLLEKIVDNGIRNTNFFNGRLLAAEDLRIEQRAHRQHENLLGQAIGPGVVSGLEVSLVSQPTPTGILKTLHVTAGVAITASGQALLLPAAEQVDLAGDPNTAQAGGDFIVCRLMDQQATPTNIGIYLLVLSPASDLRGNAPLSGLGQDGKISGCGKRDEIEGVTFRLVKVPLDGSLGIDPAGVKLLKSLVDATNLQPSISPGPIDTANLSMLRSQVAYLFLGAPTAASFARDPEQLVRWQNSLQSAFKKYGLLERMIDSPAHPLSLDDVPLALVYWTLRGIRFIDLWSVRRRTAQAFQQGPWGYALGDRRVREGEAMVLHFEEQLQALLNGQQGFPVVSPAILNAKQFFAFLPPAGLLEVAGTGSLPGIRPNVFFQGLKVRSQTQDPLFIEGAGLDHLLREAMLYPPIDTTTQELTWVYRVRENQYAFDFDRTNTPGQYLVFANGHVPYRGDPRYDLNRWGYASFA